MNTNLLKISVFLSVIFLALQIASGQTTAFKYQGSLTDGGSPANGSFQMQFKLFDAISGGTQIGSTLNDLPVAATNGVFAVSLDFGTAALNGANRWLEIAVRRNSGESYVTLSPREQISSAPYSVRTLSAATADIALDSQKLGGINASEYVTTGTVGNSFVKNDTVLQTANFNISGNGFIGGNLGIGTTTPGAKLDVEGGAIRARSSNSTHLVADMTGGTNGWSRFYAINPTQRWFLGTSRDFNGNQFYLVDETFGQSRMTVQPQGGAISFPLGNIGVGTGTPALLSGGTGKMIEISHANSPGLALTNSGTGGNQFFLYSGAFGTAGSGFFSIFDATNNANRLVINNGGNVGIGTTASTTTRMHVVNPALNGTGIRGDTASGSGSGVLGSSSSPTGWGVYGINTTADIQGRGVVGTSSHGVGVHAESASGRAIHAEGKATQNLAGYGLPKAMLFVLANGNIYQCYNGMTGTSLVGGSSTSGCGFTSTRTDAGGTGPGYSVSFPGFNVQDRYFSLTSFGNAALQQDGFISGRVWNRSGSSVSLQFFHNEATFFSVASDYMLIVY